MDEVCGEILNVVQKEELGSSHFKNISTDKECTEILDHRGVKCREQSDTSSLNFVELNQCIEKLVCSKTQDIGGDDQKQEPSGAQQGERVGNKRIEKENTEIKEEEIKLEDNKLEDQTKKKSPSSAESPSTSDHSDGSYFDYYDNQSSPESLEQNEVVGPVVWGDIRESKIAELQAILEEFHLIKHILKAEAPTLRDTVSDNFKNTFWDLQERFEYTIADCSADLKDLTDKYSSVQYDAGVQILMPVVAAHADRINRLCGALSEIRGECISAIQMGRVLESDVLSSYLQWLLSMLEFINIAQDLVRMFLTQVQDIVFKLS